MTIYLNWKGPDGRETVDEFSQEQGQTWKEFRSYVRKMADEYHLCGMNVYQSSRMCRNWRS